MMKKGSLPRSPMVQNRELEHIRQVLEMSQPLEDLFTESHRRLIAEAAQVFGKDYDSLLKFMASEIG
jgi:predicted metal-dependent hydrolase